MAKLELAVAASALAAENQRDLIRGGKIDDPQGRGARIQFLQSHSSAARSAAQHQAAIGYRFGQGCHHAGRGQQVVGARGPAKGLVGRILFGRHQHQPRQAHGLQRARGCADIARVLGADQDDADAGGGFRGDFQCDVGSVHGRRC